MYIQTTVTLTGIFQERKLHLHNIFAPVIFTVNVMNRTLAESYPCGYVTVDGFTGAHEILQLNAVGMFK